MNFPLQMYAVIAWVDWGRQDYSYECDVWPELNKYITLVLDLYLFCVIIQLKLG